MEHDNATASVYVTGVSLGCLNDLTKKWEVGFVREATHKLWWQIIKIRAGQQEVVHRPEHITPMRIIIEAFKPTHGETEIASLSGSDPERFKLLIDIEKEIYRGRKIKLKKPGHKISEMYVSNARLYSVAGMTEPAIQIIRTDAGETPRQRDIGTTAGADIQCRSGGMVVINIDGQETKLPQEDGTRYIVWFDNRCPPAMAPDADTRAAASSDDLTEITKLGAGGNKIRVVSHSDFVLFYDLIDPEGKGKYDLKKTATKGEGAVCNYSNLGNTDWMFPLPIT